VFGDITFVSDHHQGVSLLVEMTEELHNLSSGGGIEIAGGLVGENDGGIINDGSGDCDALPLSARQLIGRCSNRFSSSTRRSAFRASSRRSSAGMPR